MRRLAAVVLLAVAIGACTDGAEVGRPGSPAPTGPCSEVERIDASSEEAQDVVEELLTSIEALETLSAERMTAAVEVDDWVAFGAALDEFPPSVFLGEPVGEGRRQYSIAWTGPGFDPKAIEGSIADALEEAGRMIRANLTEAIGTAVGSEAPEHLQALADCLEIPAWLARGKPPRATAKELAIVENLRLFARSGDEGNLDEVPFSGEGVWLGLGPDLLVRRSAEELTDFSSWRLDKKGFRAYAGPFNPLDFLADPRDPEVTVGPHPHCASPPMPAPDEVANLRRVSVQPESVESCLEWYTVDLFLTPQGEIAAITMDLYEP